MIFKTVKLNLFFNNQMIYIDVPCSQEMSNEQIIDRAKEMIQYALRNNPYVLEVV